ncbi:MAG: hypothetical protein ACPGRY_16635, partial [Candidatus Latescibacterota bacterium]
MPPIFPLSASQSAQTPSISRRVHFSLKLLTANNKSLKKQDLITTKLLNNNILGRKKLFFTSR